MIDIQHGLKQVTSRQRWAARGASFMVKVKATKAVWFPPEPAKSGQQVASAGAEAAGTTTKKAAKKTAGKPARKTSGAAKKAAGSTGRKTAAAKKTAKKTAKKATTRKSA